MKLIIDRSSTKKGYYHFSFGVDYDISIFEEEIWMAGVSKETMVEIDKIITKSAELKWCVLYIKHPLLLESFELPDPTKKSIGNFFRDENVKHILRSYFAIRLQHRRFPVDLIEIGKRLFK